MHQDIKNPWTQAEYGGDVCSLGRASLNKFGAFTDFQNIIVSPLLEALGSLTLRPPQILRL